MSRMKPQQTADKTKVVFPFAWNHQGLTLEVRRRIVTECVIRDPEDKNRIVASGATVRNPIDPDNPGEGARLAVLAALKEGIEIKSLVGPKEEDGRLEIYIEGASKAYRKMARAAGYIGQVYQAFADKHLAMRVMPVSEKPKAPAPAPAPRTTTRTTTESFAHTGRFVYTLPHLQTLARQLTMEDLRRKGRVFALDLENDKKPASIEPPKLGEWVTNVRKGSMTANALFSGNKARPPYVEGPPKATPWYSTEALTAVGLVGVYEPIEESKVATEASMANTMDELRASMDRHKAGTFEAGEAKIAPVVAPAPAPQAQPQTEEPTKTKVERWLIRAGLK